MKWKLTENNKKKKQTDSERNEFYVREARSHKTKKGQVGNVKKTTVTWRAKMTKKKKTIREIKTRIGQTRDK